MAGDFALLLPYSGAAAADAAALEDAARALAAAVADHDPRGIAHWVKQTGRCERERRVPWWPRPPHTHAHVVGVDRLLDLKPPVPVALRVALVRLLYATLFGPHCDGHLQTLIANLLIRLLKYGALSPTPSAHTRTLPSLA